jgi:hypothetical protein
MGTKHIEMIEHTCDRCGDVEKIVVDTGTPDHRKERSKGLCVTFGDRNQPGPLFTEAAFKRIVTANEYPESAQEIRLRLCAGCRSDFAQFLNEKK